jgi:hypothetical protein
VLFPTSDGSHARYLLHLENPYELPISCISRDCVAAPACRKKLPLHRRESAGRARHRAKKRARKKSWDISRKRAIGDLLATGIARIGFQ